MRDTVVNISVIIPHYNSFESLEVCLKSIPAREDVQIIVVDDSSPVKDAMIGLKKEFPLVQFVELKNNVGAGAARNIGLQRALGKWVLFADADDYFLPDAFKVFYSYIEENADVIFFKANSIDAKTGKASNRHLQINKNVDLFIKEDIEKERNLRYRSYVPYCKLIARDFIFKYNIKFDEVKWGNDVMFSVKVGYYANLIKAVKKEVYCVTRTEGSLTRNFSGLTNYTRFRVAVEYNKFLKDHAVRGYNVALLLFVWRAFVHSPSYVPKMIQEAIKERINIFTGLGRWYKVFYKSNWA